MHKPKRPTDVSLVLEVIVKRDDFMNRTMIYEALPSLGRARIGMALTHLLHYHCIEAVAVGQELWFMPTPERDTRVFALKEIKDGITRKRQPKRRPVAPGDRIVEDGKP